MCSSAEEHKIQQMAACGVDASVRSSMQRVHQPDDETLESDAASSDKPFVGNCDRKP